MKCLIIVFVVVLFLYLTGKINIQTNIPELNAIAKLPIQIPLKDIFTPNVQASNPNQLVQVSFTL